MPSTGQGCPSKLSTALSSRLHVAVEQVLPELRNSHSAPKLPWENRCFFVADMKGKFIPKRRSTHAAVGHNQWYQFGVGAPPMLVFFGGDWDVHWGNDLAFDPWPCESTEHSTESIRQAFIV